MIPRVILAPRYSILPSKIPEMIQNFSLSTRTDKLLVQCQCTDKVKVRSRLAFTFEQGK